MHPPLHQQWPPSDSVTGCPGDQLVPPTWCKPGQPGPWSGTLAKTLVWALARALAWDPGLGPWC